MRYFIFLASFLACFPSICKASATQTVTFSSTAIAALSLNTSIGALTISSATAGSLPNDATSSGVYSLTANGTGMVITGSIGSAMPTNLQLLINMTAPTGTTSAGSVPMTTTAVNLISSITQLFQSSLAITGTLHQTGPVASMSSFTQTLTLTLTN